MELTNKQIEGLQLAVDRYNQGEKYTVIAGYAGTGKSTLVKFIISALPNINPDEDVVYTSFTGKATQVLQKKGNKNVSTLHKLLFESIPKPDGTFFRKPVDDIPYKIVIVDECSMVPNDLLKRLSSYNKHVICLGDPCQLPPVSKDEDNHLLDNPHIFLDEIMRQEQDSEIIKLTMDIRAGMQLNTFKGKEVQVLEREEFNPSMLLWADQVICATNSTRIALNNAMRDLLGKEGDPQEGEKIICLKNNWDIVSDNDNALVNGTVGYLKNPFNTFLKIPSKFTGDGKTKELKLTCGEFISDTNESYGEISMDKNWFINGESGLDWKTAYKMGKDWKFKEVIPEQFTYGYAITGWKAQGSEWDKVLVIEEGFPYDKEEHKKFLYTCATRAASKLVIIKK